MCQRLSSHGWMQSPPLKMGVSAFAGEGRAGQGDSLELSSKFKDFACSEELSDL